MPCILNRDFKRLGVYSKVLDRKTNSPTNAIRDEKAGACQVRPSIYDMNGTGGELASNLFCLIEVEECKASTAYIRNFSTYSLGVI